MQGKYLIHSKTQYS